MFRRIQDSMIPVLKWFFSNFGQCWTPYSEVRRGTIWNFTVDSRDVKNNLHVKYFVMASEYDTEDFELNMQARSKQFVLFVGILNNQVNNLFFFWWFLTDLLDRLEKPCQMILEFHFSNQIFIKPCKAFSVSVLRFAFWEKRDCALWDGRFFYSHLVQWLLKVVKRIQRNGEKIPKFFQ